MSMVIGMPVSFSVRLRLICSPLTSTHTGIRNRVPRLRIIGLLTEWPFGHERLHHARAIVGKEIGCFGVLGKRLVDAVVLGEPLGSLSWLDDRSDGGHHQHPLRLLWGDTRLMRDILVFDAALFLEPADLGLPACDCPLDILGVLESRLTVGQGPAVERLREVLIDLFFRSGWVGKAEGNGQKQADEHGGQHRELAGAMVLAG